MTARMLVAAHKSALIPTDPLYLPIHVGHALNPVDLGYQTDDQGDNISHLNATYCELTALYWAWKNLPAGPIGLSHYRRYFVGTAAGPNGSQVLGFAEAESLLAAHDIIVGKPRNYVVETIDSHYRNGHHGEDLDLLREVMSAMHPADLPAFDRVFSGRKLSLYNMFLARREVFDAYATWVFPVLSEVSTQVQSDDRTAYQQRTIGYLGERLLNVWVAARSENLSIGTRKIVNVEGEPKISKAIGLIKRKISGGSDR